MLHRSFAMHTSLASYSTIAAGVSHHRHHRSSINLTPTPPPVVYHQCRHARYLPTRTMAALQDAAVRTVQPTDLQWETLCQLETNIDDLSPQVYRLDYKRLSTCHPFLLYTHVLERTHPPAHRCWRIQARSCVGLAPSTCGPVPVP